MESIETNKIIEDPNRKTYRVGECKYCHNMVTVEADEDIDQETVDEMASFECSCTGAQLAYKQQSRLNAAKLYVQNRFMDNENQISLMLCAIHAVFNGAVDAVTIKIAKHTYRVALDSNGMIVIKTTFRDTGTEEF